MFERSFYWKRQKRKQGTNIIECLLCANYCSRCFHLLTHCSIPMSKHSPFFRCRGNWEVMLLAWGHTTRGWWKQGSIPTLPGNHESHHLTLSVPIALVMIWHQWNTRACCSASQEPSSRHCRSQEHLLAKKGNNFLYVNSGQMVADAEESGNPDHSGLKASTWSSILGTEYARDGQSTSQRLKGKTLGLLREKICLGG